MTHLRLLQEISFTLVDGRAVFLDLCRDRYVGLDSGAAEAFDALRASPDGTVDSGACASLLATGLFARADRPGRFLPAEISAPDRDVREVPKRGLKDALQILFLLVRARHAVRCQPLANVIARRRAPVGSCSTEKALSLTRRFLSARALVPIKPSCLQDSLALHDWLTAGGAAPNLVFGIQLDPFAAHCWVQLGKTVLNDASDRVAAYKPILVVD